MPAVLPGAPGGVPDGVCPGAEGVWLPLGVPEEGGAPGGALLPGWEGDEPGEPGGMLLGLLGVLGLLGGGGGGLLLEEQAVTSTTSDTRVRTSNRPAVFRVVPGTFVSEFRIFVCLLRTLVSLAVPN
ncbi:MAG: hypothetical protein R3E82_04545 [Pseudomonadales bacterium]